jgi:hypothetical protein
MLLSGWYAHNADLAEHGAKALAFLSYLSSGEFLSALFENWESEFLQMAAYVVFTAILFQRGSAESRDPDDPDRPNDKKLGSGVSSWLYAHSLGLTLAGLFVASFLVHWRASLTAANEEAARHGAMLHTPLQYLVDSTFWFESFQNWQSEFLSTAVLVVLSIFLRHQGSPESKPLNAPNSDTGS